MSFQSDISKLIFHHLVKEGYESSATSLIRDCPHLIELKRVQPPYKLPRLMGPSLVNLIENYFETKENIIEQLELLESVVFREQDDLLNLTKTLVENLKLQTPSTSQVQKETSDASVNTDVVSKDGLQTHDASVNTESFNINPETCDVSINTEPASSTPETCDVSVNTESFSTPKTSISSCNTECVGNKPETCDASVNTEAVFSQEKNDSNHLVVENSQVPKETQNATEIPDAIDSPEDVSNQVVARKTPETLPTSQLSKHGCEGSVNTAWVLNNVLQEDSLHCSEQLEVCAETIDFSLVYDRLLEDKEFQEKIAENINKKKAEVILPSKGSSKRGSLASSQDLDTVIKAIVAETQADPAFDNFLNDCIGIDSEDQTSVGTPDSTAQDGECTVAHYDGRNQENCLIPANLGAAMIVEPSTIAPSVFTVQNPDLIENSSMINGLNSVAILTSSGQITLVPTIISAIPADAEPSVREKRKKKITPIARRPVAIAPKPIFTITIPAPESNYQFPNAAGVSEIIEQRVEDQQQPADCNIENINIASSPGPSTTKPMKVTSRPLAKSRRRNVAKNINPAEKFITPSLAALVKIAQEYGSSATKSIQNQEAVGEKEPLKSPDVVFDSPPRNSTDFVTTPTSTRRLSHVRQLNFGESPELSNKPASPAVRPERSEIPWDLALRNAVAAPPPPDSEVFATPKGKAKRRRRSSPAVVIETESVEKTSSCDPVASTSTSSSTVPQQISFPDSSTTTEENTTADVVSEETPRLCNSTNPQYADLVAASILHEMANAPVMETTSAESLKQIALENTINERIASESNLPHFGMDIINREEQVIQQPLPVLATPRKEITENVAGLNSLNSVAHAMLCDGQSNSTSFGAWDGEIPRTPQIRLDLTSSTSPFQVSLTKGFRFLPTAESPSLPVPATPCIFEVNSSNNSIETPYTGFYQFPSVLSTPRLEALRQEIMESPGKTLSTTVISPTQVVLGRPTPYFVPSGERAQGPMNQSATPEHVPETDKLERRRRRTSSTEMDPLQLEESNDASDAAAALMCKAAETAAAALRPPSPLQSPPLHQPPTPHQLPTPHQSPSPVQPPSPLQPPTPHQPPTPYKTDQTLENDLINECQRLEDDPCIEKANLRNQRLVELFGEDSTNPSEILKSTPSVSGNVPAVALAQSTPIITEKKTRKPRRTANSKLVPGDDSVSSACARAQVYSLSPQAHRRKSQRRSTNSKISTSREDENLIQELLALSRLNSVIDPVAQSPLSKRKRRSDSTNMEKNGSTSEISSEKRSKRKRISNVSVVMSEEQFLATNEVVPISTPSTSSPKEDIDVVSFVESVTDSPTKSKKSKKTSKEKVKSSTKVKAKSTSPNVRGMATRSTPVKLFKSSLPPYSRKCVSYRQSVGVKKTPRKIQTDADVTDEERSLVSDSAELVEVIDSNLPVSTSVVDDVQLSKNDDGKGEDNYHRTRSTDQVSDTQMETSVTAENVPQQLNADQPEIVMEVETLTEKLTKNTPKEPEVLMEVIGQDAQTQPNISVADAPVDSTSVLVDRAADDGEPSDDIVISPICENSCLVLATLPEGSTLSTNISVPSSCTENPHERICSSETTMSPLCEQRLPLTEESLLPVLVSPANGVGSSSPYLYDKLESTQKLSSPSAIASKEKNNRASNTKLKNYLRLQSLSTTSPQMHPTVTNLSVSEGNAGTQVKSPASSNRQHFQPQANVIMDKELVNKMRKQLRMSKEIDLYSQ